MYTLVSNLSQERGHPSQLWGFSDIRFSLQNHWGRFYRLCRRSAHVVSATLDGDPYEIIQMVSCSSRCLYNSQTLSPCRGASFGGQSRRARCAP